MLLSFINDDDPYHTCCSAALPPIMLLMTMAMIMLRCATAACYYHCFFHHRPYHSVCRMSYFWISSSAASAWSACRAAPRMAAPAVPMPGKPGIAAACARSSRRGARSRSHRTPPRVCLPNYQPPTGPPGAATGSAGSTKSTPMSHVFCFTPTPLRPTMAWGASLCAGGVSLSHQASGVCPFPFEDLVWKNNKGYAACM